MQKLSEILARLGLNEKETKVFLSLVKLGPSPVGKIAQDAVVTRTHVYDIVEALGEKGFLSVIEKKGVRIYEALEHVGLLALLGRRSREIEALGKQITEAAGEFESLRGGARPKKEVRFFEGKEAVLNIWDEIRDDLKKIKEPSEIVTIFSPEQLERTFPGWFDQKQFIHISPLMTKRDIVDESELFKKHAKERAESVGHYAYKIWPRGRGEFPIDTLCWQNKIAYIELTEHPSGVVIENKAMADTFRMWFEKMWESL